MTQILQNTTASRIFAFNARICTECRLSCIKFSLLTVYYEHNSDVLPIVELDGRGLSPQQRREERYWEMSKLTNTKIHRHGIAWRIHAIASIRNRAGKRTRVLPTASGALHPLCPFAGILCCDTQQKSSLYQETVHPVPQHKETPRSAHLCAGEYLQLVLFA